jgi:hypothetical protein
MPFASKKLVAQGHPAPAQTSLPYPITAHYGYVLLWSTLTPAEISTLMAGHTVTATIRRIGTQPGTGTPYPTVIFHTYTYTRNGQPNDVLGAELSAPQNFLINTNYLIILRVTDPAGNTVGLSTNTTFKFI